MTAVDFYYSIGSRYSYLASTQISHLVAEAGCRVEWYPVNSVELIARRGGPSPFEGSPVSGQYEWPYRELDARRWAEYYGVPFVEPRGRVGFDPQTTALATMAAKRLGHVEQFSHELFAAMFRDPVTSVDEQECAARGERCGIPRTTLLQQLHDPATASDLDATIDRALRAGVFGVPAFIVDGELFWGNDRLVLLRDYLLEKRVR